MKKLLLTLMFTLFGGILFAQDLVSTSTLTYDPERLKIIPDKVFEFGVPLLFLFLVLNTIVTVMKYRAEHQIKLKMIEKGISEDSLLKIFQEANAIQRMQPLKWFLFSLATGISFLIIHFLKDYLTNQSGYLAVGMVLILNALAFAIYYSVLSRKH